MPEHQEEYNELPDIEYKPLNDMDDRTPVYEEDEDDDVNIGRIIGWVVVLVVLVGAFFCYRLVYLPKKQKENGLVKTEEVKEYSGEVGVVRSNEMELIATSPEGCKVYSVRNHLITICPTGYNATETK